MKAEEGGGGGNYNRFANIFQYLTRIIRRIYGRRMEGSSVRKEGGWGGGLFGGLNWFNKKKLGLE